MTMTRRLALLIGALLLTMLLGGVLMQTLSARDALRSEQRARQQDSAEALARLLVQARQGQGEGADPAAILNAGFDPAYRRLLLLDSDGRALAERQAPARPAQVPAWFARAFAFDVGAAVAELAQGAQARQVPAQLSLELHDAQAMQALWRASKHAALGLALLALVLAGAAAWLLRAWRRPLRAALDQAEAIVQSRLVSADEPDFAELRTLTRAMNTLVRRLRESFDSEAEQVARLQQQTQTDAVSGLPVRAQFTLRIADMLADTAGPAVALLLVRVPNLERLNERHGREATDRLLAGLADVLLTYVERVPGTSAGRLNGTDFALALPVVGIARETAGSLRTALEAAPAARLAGAEFLVGGCDGLRGVAASAALAAADAALARAEQGDGIVVVDLPDAVTSGSRAWREQIASALAQSRVQIGAYPVVDRHGVLIHLECPLRVQLEPGGDYQVARRWLALAARSRLLPEIDLAAVDLALAAIADDTRPRCVHVAPRSFAGPEFAARLQARLDAHPAQASALSIEWTESPRPADNLALHAAVAGWRRAGVTVGVEHAGASPKALAPLKQIGVDYIKVDARHLRGLAADEAVRAYAASLADLIHGLALKAIAEGIEDGADLAALWLLGYDGATGAAVVRPSS